MTYKSISKRFSLRGIVQPWQDMDWLLLMIVTSMTLFAGIIIRSTELSEGLTDWWQHWVIGGIGLLIVMILARWRYDNLIQWYWLIYLITNVSLLAVMFMGTEALGAQRWITIGGFNIQPSEFAKIGAIITLAGVLHERTASTLPMMIKALAVIAVPWGIVFIQPDLGTSLVFGAITLGMLYWGNANPGWLVLLVSPLAAAILFNVSFPVWVIWVVAMGVIGWRTLPWAFFGALGATVVNLVSGGLGQVLWGLLKDYQKDRLILFLDPDKDPLGGGYHLIQSRIAIGSGQLWGRG
ncbi:MAG: FtsW/RodA/SpoVE family cell cycle protein, partial [Elainellaceae cyanobacterium]